MAKKILTVDDSRTMRSLVSLTLLQAGFEVVEAANATEALQAASEHRLDAVITDVNMPGMNGIALVQALRAKDAYRTVPIVVLTVESEKHLREESRDAGATGWIVKPFHPQQLVKMMQKLCTE